MKTKNRFLKVTLSFAVIIFVCLLVVVLKNGKSDEAYCIEKHNLLFCFSVSGLGDKATFYQVGKDGTLIRSEGIAKSPYITDSGYFLTYEEITNDNTEITVVPEYFKIKQQTVIIPDEDLEQLKVLLATCVETVKEGTALIDKSNTQRLVHALLYNEKTYYNWADSRGYTKDELSLIGYKLEELSGVEETKYNGDSQYYEAVEIFLQNNELFLSEYGKPELVSGARDWPLKSEADSNWTPFAVETQKYKMVIYIRFGGTNPNGEKYIYEFEVASIENKSIG